MDRRAFLALLTGTGAALAGCNGPDETPTATPTGAATDSPTETGTPPSETTTATEEPTDTATGTATEEPTPEPTETATGAERATRAIETATGALGETVDAYGAAADGNGDVTLLTVDVTVPFTTDRLSDPLTRAEEAIARAEESATGDQVETVERLRSAATWLRNLGEAQAAAAEAFETYVAARDAIYAGEASAAASAAGDLEPLVDPVESGLDAATESAGAEDAAVVPGVTAELFQNKNAQLRAAARTFRLVVEEAEPTAAAIATFVAGVADYEERQFGQARRHFRAAKGSLANASTALYAPDVSASAVGEETTNLACATEHLAAAADDLQTSADAGSEDNGSRRRRFLGNAKDRLSGCNGIFEELPLTERTRNLE
jgi:hypothetical protein